MATQLQKKRLVDHAIRARLELEEIYVECVEVTEDTSDLQNAATETLTYLANVEQYVAALSEP